MNQPSSSFTGRQRDRSTHWSVKFKDRLAHTVVIIGGIGTIVAVFTVCVFLVAVVIPLFRSPDIEKQRSAGLPSPEQAQHPVHVAVDDYNLMAWAVFADGVVRKFRLDTGESLDEVRLADHARLTSWSFPQRDSLAIFGYADGSVRFANIQFNLDFIELADAPAPLRELDPGAVATHENGLVQMTTERQLRHVTLGVELQEPLATGSDKPIVLIDHTGSRDDISYAAMAADGRIFVQRARGRRNLLTGKVTYRITTGEIEYEARPRAPAYLMLTGLGDNLYAIWEDGILYRFDIRDFRQVERVETVDLSPAPGVPITCIGYMIGKTTLLVGDADGNVSGWFRVRPEDVSHNPGLTVSMRTVQFDKQGVNRGPVTEVKVKDISSPDELALVPTQHLPGPKPPSPVTSLAPSERKRLFVAGHGNGIIRVHNATVERTLFELKMPNGAEVALATLNPRDNGLVGVSAETVALWQISVPHSEATWNAYFRPLWYEGYAEPRHVWQSTGGTDDFESKFGLMPLIFGTVKATFYCMLFAVPVALLAAVFTSEFLHPRLKSKIKPAVEMMASLPSVVLGFLAGLVLAQFIETRVPALLTALVIVPATLVFLASLWQLLPRTMQMRGRRLRFWLMVLAIPSGLWLAGLAGPLFERAFFSVRILDEQIAQEMIGEMAAEDIEHSEGAVVVRDFRTWLSAHRQNPRAPTFESSPVGGWMILFTPLSLLLSLFLAIRYINPWMLARTAMSSRLTFAWLDLLKFVIVGLSGLACAFVLALLFGTFWDPRGGYIDQYVQRNALVVGCIMGFAVVPIIYTIADDAMSAVPEHLRSASLGAGATRWQTAVRIIIPTSMSGLFSAVMIGFGRAVGETMIVLMAAGNTPIMEWNIFSGFRTLSANIAVEMMEAVEGSTNYRTLFLTAVILFALTFAINTIAETVRLRYRKRAYQL